MPKETTHGQSVRLDGNEYSVLTDPSAVFEAPVNEKLASLTATHVGNFGYLVDIGSGTSKKQYVRIQANKSKPATPLLLIRDVDVDNKSVFVSINPNKLS